MDAKPKVSKANEVFSSFGHPLFKINGVNLAAPTNKKKPQKLLRFLNLMKLIPENKKY